jgi:hypothetical protein
MQVLLLGEYRKFMKILICAVLLMLFFAADCVSNTQKVGDNSAFATYNAADLRPVIIGKPQFGDIKRVGSFISEAYFNICFYSSVNDLISRPPTPAILISGSAVQSELSYWEGAYRIYGKPLLPGFPDILPYVPSNSAYICGYYTYNSGYCGSGDFFSVWRSGANVSGYWLAGGKSQSIPFSWYSVKPFRKYDDGVYDTDISDRISEELGYNVALTDGCVLDEVDGGFCLYNYPRDIVALVLKNDAGIETTSWVLQETLAKYGVLGETVNCAVTASGQNLYVGVSEPGHIAVYALRVRLPETKSLKKVVVVPDLSSRENGENLVSMCEFNKQLLICTESELYIAKLSGS